MNALSSFFAQIGPARVLAALGVTTMVAVALIMLTMRVGNPEKQLLFADIDPAEAAQIAERLDGAGIEYDVRGDGSSIFVPRDKVSSARMMLAADGLPSSGSVGYEIFDKTDALGQTTFQQNIARLRALEGELGRTIGSLDGVRAARVHLVIPERRLFEKTAAKPSASIVIAMKFGDLTPAQVRAIRNLTASAVPGLELNQVTIVNEKGNLLAAGGDSADIAGASLDERRIGVEDHMRKVVLDIVEGVVGQGAARVQITADMDFNRVTETKNSFDPDGQVVRSQTTIEETGSSADSSNASGTSAAGNVPGGTPTGGAAGGSSSNNNKSTETINYDISSTVRTEVFETGRVKKLSVAVAIDDLAKTDAAGKTTFTPRTAAEIARIDALVKSAIGFDQARGDVVSVVNLGFNRPMVEPIPAAAGPFNLAFTSNDIMRGVEIGAALVVALAMIFFVARPMLNALFRPSAAVAAVAGAVAGSPAGATANLTTPISGASVSVAPGQPATITLPSGTTHEVANDGIEEMINVASIEGMLKASSVKKVAEVIDKNPEDALNILRTIMAED